MLPLAITSCTGIQPSTVNWPSHVSAVNSKHNVSLVSLLNYTIFSNFIFEVLCYLICNKFYHVAGLHSRRMPGTASDHSVTRSLPPSVNSPIKWAFSGISYGSQGKNGENF